MTDTALVTGGLGRSGRWICDRLADEGWDVVCVDRDHPGFETWGREGVDFRAADVTDRGEVTDLVAGVDPDAVVHWAAIPVPTRHPDGRVFDTNVGAAHSVLVAAGRADARIVLASSESTYGFPFASERTLPEYLPVDEAHPKRPEDAYGLSKVVAEEVAASVARRHGVQVASLRPSWIQYPGEYTCLVNQENPQEGAGNFWSYVDVRDVASLVVAALETDFGGHEPFLALADDNCLGRPTAEAVREFYGGLPEQCDLEGEECAFSNAKAREVLGWEPDHDWRSAADEDVETPSLVAE
ncbi:NAD(P)-dependent oxidoreductase [Halobacteriales archaeon QS_1_68_20]|nr:MAG: NAD(P)-dependent oxidoreductase [Halobacteriales archaeon QS_1_68_20]